MYNLITTDLLVLGGGAAGVRAAIQGAEEGLRVLCLSKGPIGRTGITPVAGEGIEAPMDPEDSPEEFYQDTVKAGRGLADQALVRAMTMEARQRILDLEAYGGKFKKDEKGNFLQSPRPGQTHARNCYIKGGGWGLMQALLAKAVTLPNLEIWTDTMAVRLLARDDRVTGALVLDVRTGSLHTILSRATVVATGGYEELWPVTDTPPEATGEGTVLAYQVGARLVDLEMILYYPTIFIYPPAARGFLLQYEYIMNPDILDGRLLNGNKEEFLEGFPLRDEIIRAVHDEIKAGRASPNGGFYLDFSRSRYNREELTRRLQDWVPVQFSNLQALGIDIREELTEMAPAAHYCLGGIKIDPYGATGIPGLVAAGEVAGNVHGANRLSGSALTETQVFGVRAVQTAAEDLAKEPLLLKDHYREQWEREIAQIARWTERKELALSPRQAKKALQKVMGEYLGPYRDGAGISQGLTALEGLRDQVSSNLTVNPIHRYCYEIREAYELSFMLQLARLTLLAARERTESRGHHFRTDHPHLEPEPYHTLVSQGQEGPLVNRIPVVKED